MSDTYVKRDFDGEIVFRGDLQSCVAFARNRCRRTNSFTVASTNMSGDETVFNTYPQADDQWAAWQRMGLVPNDSPTNAT